MKSFRAQLLTAALALAASSSLVPASAAAETSDPTPTAAATSRPQANSRSNRSTRAQHRKNRRRRTNRRNRRRRAVEAPSSAWVAATPAAAFSEELCQRFVLTCQTQLRPAWA